MITEIGASRYRSRGVIFALLFFLILLIAFTLALVHQFSLPVFIPWAIMLFGCILIIHSLFFLPSGLIFDTDTKEKEIKYPFIKSDFLELKDVIYFTKTQIWTRGQYCNGDFIYLSDNKRILISEFSLEDNGPFENWLEEEKIQYNGEQKAKMFSYYFQYLKRK